ncbi:cupin domain-containing protein [Actinoplanes sp. TFC3]|uniref:cupin domain-containing protein n=1 Tax=Actinoplanes sp. TFC3 TaxID=1710355 RepID=UPI00082F7D77|nr:cupin domain-containing protein [Actinoplanes sp. TFC3]
MHGSEFHSYVSPSSGSRELCAWRLEVAPGTRGVPHRVSKEEILLLLEGELTATVDGVATTARAGDVVLVPAGSAFGIDNTSPSTATAWVTTSVGLQATLDSGEVISPPWTR